MVDYAILGDTMKGKKEYSFAVAGTNQTWRWGFHSCNGFHDPKVVGFGGF